MKKRVSIAVLWEQGPVSGSIEVNNGELADLRWSGSKAQTKGTTFRSSEAGPRRLIIDIQDARLDVGPGATRVTVLLKCNSFTLFLRDVNPERPIFIPTFHAAVTVANDPRDYARIATAVRARGGVTKLQAIEGAPEETFVSAAAATRRLHGPTWLGISRDMRIFEVDTRSPSGVLERIKPRDHNCEVRLPENDNNPIFYGYSVGRGWGCVEGISRRLEDGCLPILHTDIADEDVNYHLTSFASLEKSRLVADRIRGTHYLVADGNAAGHMFTEEQQKKCEALWTGEVHREEETVLFLQATAVNSSSAPRYAWFYAIAPLPIKNWSLTRQGFGSLNASGRVFSIQRLNGKPMIHRELAVLLQPGEQAVFECFLLHRPISRQRAMALSKANFEARRAECREFWTQKLESEARIELPEPVINNMVKAGLLHLDLVAYGKEPTGSIAATIGIYSPIGSESAPIIQFFDSMGWHKVAERAIGYFLEKQHKDGFIQNFGNYMLETGPALWTMGEHYRYTHNDAWVRRIKPKLILACEYMLAWRQKNMKPALKKCGYGMMDGKVGDPEDPFYIFMLNGYGYVGMKRTAEMLRRIAPAESRRWDKEAEALKKDILDSFFHGVAISPVIPLGDGTWVPTAPPWAGNPGPVSLFAEPGTWWTHGTFLCRDSLVGPLYLLLQEVLDADDPIIESLVNYHAEMMVARNVALSQPFYSRHDYAHLQRGEVKAFLKTYYNGLTGLADRETYSWWEHFFHASPHKTHEEAWFLMQTRWMLWMEEGDTLHLFRAIPRRWIEDGKRIELKRVASYFGPISAIIESRLNEGVLTARVECRGNRRPKEVVLRLPHPEGRTAVRVEGGIYDPATETVRISRFKGPASVLLRF